MKIARIPLWLAFLALALLLVGGPGYRLDLWGLGFGLLGVSRYALVIGAGAAVLALVFLVIPKLRRDRAAGLVLALELGLTVAAVPLYVRHTAQSLPYIHDITTDTVDPPRFIAIAPLRADAPNPVEYPGADVAKQQRETYPDIEPLRTALDPSRLFEHALATARGMGWEIVAAEPENGRIEGTATTLWYGFRDDVVIRIRPADGGSRLDIRSKSRVGMSDLGANAERIRDYIGALEGRLGEL